MLSNKCLFVELHDYKRKSDSQNLSKKGEMFWIYINALGYSSSTVRNNIYLNFSLSELLGDKFSLFFISGINYDIEFIYNRSSG